MQKNIYQIKNSIDKITTEFITTDHIEIVKRNFNKIVSTSTLIKPTEYTLYKIGEIKDGKIKALKKAEYIKDGENIATLDQDHKNIITKEIIKQIEEQLETKYKKNIEKIKETKNV